MAAPTSIVGLLCRDLMLEREHVDALVENLEAHYKAFNLDGRRIDAPKIELKYVQCWVLDFVRAETPMLPDYVAAYEPGRSVVFNAALHRRNEHLLCMDIKSFFRSCTSEMVGRFFETMTVGGRRLSASDVGYLTALSTLRGTLPMGSPCSPAIANRIMLPVDEELRGRLGPDMVYSRYSDDICVSSNERIDVSRVLDTAREVLGRHGFVLNEKKSRCMGRGDARRVTGVYIDSNGSLSIGSRRKRILNQKLYRYLVHGEGSACEIRGQLDFARMVDPSYVTELLLKYASYGAARTNGGVMGALMNGMGC